MPFVMTPALGFAPLLQIRKYVALGVAAALLPLMFVGYVSHRQAEETLLSEYATRLDTLAVERRQALRLLAGQREAALLALARSAALADFAAQLDQAERPAPGGRPGRPDAPSLPIARFLFDGILVVDAQGTVRHAAGTLQASQADRWAEDLAGAKEGSWIRLQGGAGEPPFLLIGLPLSIDRGLKGGAVVLVRSTLTDFDGILADRHALGAGGESFVADRNGRVVIPALRYSDRHGESIEGGPMQRCLRGEAQAFTIAPDYAGIQMAMAYQPLPELGGGCLMVHMPAAEIVASTRALRDKMWLLSGIAGITLVPLGLVIGRGVRRKAEAALQQAREELERQVSKRTAELEEANAALLAEVTVRRQAEDALQDLNLRMTRHAKEVEAANQELEVFSYSVSHDLRAPLRSIDGFAHALLEDCADRLTEQGKDYLHRMRAASQRMGQLMDDLLGLARMSRWELHRQPVNVSDLAESVGAEIRETWPNRQVELTVQPGMQADADPAFLRLLLGHLLDNAWKFTSKQEWARIEVGAKPHEGATAFFVRDNGAGFDMAYAGKLFGAFQRLHTIREFSGTGIGLATVRRIVARHGGRAWAEGRVGEGACFYFTLGG